MKVQHLDHINIRTDRLSESLHFYGTLLGMTAKPPPTMTDYSKGAYFCDDDGRAIVHLIGAEQRAESVSPVRGAAQRGMIDHFSLRVSGRPETLKQRLEAQALEYEELDADVIRTLLIFVRDPNGIMVELGFPWNSDGG
jgi:catechol 2,3-dioxygenase-like lactoylglutathione lyase family enzyme